MSQINFPELYSQVIFHDQDQNYVRREMPVGYEVPEEFRGLITSRYEQIAAELNVSSSAVYALLESAFNMDMVTLQRIMDCLVISKAQQERIKQVYEIELHYLNNQTSVPYSKEEAVRTAFIDLLRSGKQFKFNPYDGSPMLGDRIIMSSALQKVILTVNKQYNLSLPININFDDGINLYKYFSFRPAKQKGLVDLHTVTYLSLCQSLGITPDPIYSNTAPLPFKHVDGRGMFDNFSWDKVLEHTDMITQILDKYVSNKQGGYALIHVSGSNEAKRFDDAQQDKLVDKSCRLGLFPLIITDKNLTGEGPYPFFRIAYGKIVFHPRSVEEVLAFALVVNLRIVFTTDTFWTWITAGTIQLQRPLLNLSQVKLFNLLTLAGQRFAVPGVDNYVAPSMQYAIEQRMLRANGTLKVSEYLGINRKSAAGIADSDFDCYLENIDATLFNVEI